MSTAKMCHSSVLGGLCT